MKPSMRCVLGLAVVAAVAMAPSSARASAELEIGTAKIAGSTVKIQVANTLSNASVTGRLMAYYDDGKGTQERVVSLELKPSETVDIEVSFDLNKSKPTAIIFGTVPLKPGSVPIGPIILGTITDDINPF